MRPEIPDYPGSRALDIGDRDSLIETLSKTKPEICEYTFGNLYAWRSMYNINVSKLGGFVLLSSRKVKEISFFEPAGEGGMKELIKKVSAETSAPFIFISEKTAKMFENDREFSVTSGRDNSDYVYRVSDLVELKGKKYDGKRNYIKRFRSANKYKYTALESKNAKECMDFVEKWCRFRDCEGQESLIYEKNAIKEMLDNISYLGLSGGAIEIDGEISALAIGEKLNPEMFVMHVLKAKPGITGLNQAMNNEFLKREAAGFSYVNMEQDLGVEGLRKSKLSYHPLKLVSKYSIAPARKK